MRETSHYDARVGVPSRRFAAALTLFCLHTATSACGSRGPLVGAGTPDTSPVTPPLRVETAADECALVASSREPITAVGVSERVDPANAPRPTNEGERLLFRQLYETLVRVDCHGRALPGLAAAWRLEADGSTWILTLREGAVFADGTRVTADHVRASWMRDGASNDLRPHAARLLQSVTAVDDRTLAVVLQRYQADAPMALAHEDLAIARRTAASAWPIGTRSRQVAGDSPPQPGAGSVITLTGDGLPTLHFLVAPGDARDLLDRNVDLLLTRDPAALDYAASLPRFESAPLEWQRTRLLLTPVPLRSSPAAGPDARQLLAADAVRGEARGAQGTFWWESSECGVAPLAVARRATLVPRVVYDANDGASRDLAERLVGLRLFQRAVGLSVEAMLTALRRGTDAAYIVSVASSPREPCYELQSLTDAAPWLEPKTLIVPLVETRLRAIVRRGVSGVTMEGDGGLRLIEQIGPGPQ